MTAVIECASCRGVLFVGALWLVFTTVIIAATLLNPVRAC
jgi:type II secretory pathway component PulK